MAISEFTVKPHFFRRLFLNGQPEHRDHAVDGLVLPLDRAAAVGHGVPHATAGRVKSRANLLHQDASHCEGETQVVVIGELNNPIRLADLPMYLYGSCNLVKATSVCSVTLFVHEVTRSLL